MGITTKTGDDGYTDIAGKRLRKDHPLLECLGTLDELNAFLGGAKAALYVCPSGSCISGIISEVQRELSSIMGFLATASAEASAGSPVMSVPAERPGDSPEGINEARLNSLIAEIEASLPSITSFAVPGENPASAKLHIARAVCRRAERRLTALDGAAEAVLPYINRLSDLLFLLAQKAEMI
jgi:cob(I)alamin adenosyltransferase